MTTSRGLRIALLIAAAILFAIVMLFFSGTTQVAHQAVRYELSAIGQSIYEYHDATGQWPKDIGDLDRTSLPLRLRYWRASVQNGSIVIVWPDHLGADPQENQDAVLVYHNRGLLAWLGRQWVCWGDLRTEYVSSKRLKAALAATR
jgi:hypothetical protein